jgi:anti-sigma regulatory factor (Ser/Thr protein kinase)
VIAGVGCVEHPLGGEPVHVSRSRATAGQVLADWGLGEVAELAKLVVSELVTNAQQHGAGPVRLSAFRRDGTDRVCGRVAHRW